MVLSRLRRLACISLVTAGCGTSITEPASNGDLRVELPATTFTTADVAREVLVVTVRNLAAATRYTRSRDGFGNVLITPTGSDAAVERWDGRWNAIPAGMAVEGVAMAILAPGAMQALWADLSTSARPGTYRIKVSYHDANYGTTGLAQFAAYSATFIVR